MQLVLQKHYNAICPQNRPILWTNVVNNTLCPQIDRVLWTKWSFELAEGVIWWRGGCRRWGRRRCGPCRPSCTIWVCPAYRHRWFLRLWQDSRTGHWSPSYPENSRKSQTIPSWFRIAHKIAASALVSETGCIDRSAVVWIAAETSVHQNITAGEYIQSVTPAVWTYHLHIPYCNMSFQTICTNNC